MIYKSVTEYKKHIREIKQGHADPKTPPKLTEAQIEEQKKREEEGGEVRRQHDTLSQAAS